MVTKLKQVLNEPGDVDATCETAGYFYRYTIILTWEDFIQRAEKLNPTAPTKSADSNSKENNDASDDNNVEMAEDGNTSKPTEDPNKFVAENFPFRGFFDNADQLFKGEDLTTDLEKAHACYQYIQQIFLKLDEFRAFELLRNGRERSEYLLVSLRDFSILRHNIVRLGYCLFLKENLFSFKPGFSFSENLVEIP